MTFDLWLILIMVINAIINVGIIVYKGTHKSSDSSSVGGAGVAQFWMILILFCPFFVMNSIYNDMNNSNKKKPLRRAPSRKRRRR